MANISKIQIENTSYDIKDTTARNEISTLQNMNNRKVILIGDSYCEQNSDSDITKFYWEYLRDALGLTQNTNFWASYQSGAGFGNQLFLTKLQDLSSTITDKNSITDILVCGGWNDSDTSQPYGTNEMYVAGVNAFKTYVDANYPNARVSIAHISWGMPSVLNSNNVWQQMPISIIRYKDSCNTKGWRYLTGTENILHIYNTSYWQSNGSHPSQNGQTLLGNSLASAFLTGSTNVYRKLDNRTFTASGYGTTINIPYVVETINGNLVEIESTPGQSGNYIAFSSGTYNFDGGHQYEVATLNSEVMQGYGAYNLTNIPIFVMGTFSGTTTVYNGYMDMWIENNKLIIRPCCFYNGNRTEIIQPTYMWFGAFKIVGESYKC